MMPTLSPEQIYALNRVAGFSQDKAVEGTAIVLAESGGRTDVTSTQQGGTCTNVGLYQIATPCGLGAGHTVEELKNPKLNIEVAFKGSNGGQNWGDWQTWATGAYKSHLTAAEKGRALENQVVTTGAGGSSPWDKLWGWAKDYWNNFTPIGIITGGGGPFGAIDSVAGAIARVGQGITTFLKALTDYRMWRSLGWIVLGIWVLFLGFILLFRKQITEAAGTAAGAAIKAV
jgi:hypothetical protein